MRNFKDVPEQVWHDIDYEMARSGEEHVDNMRAYRVSDDLYKREFMISRDKGCCGSYEGATVVDGERWIVGCNFGH